MSANSKHSVLQRLKLFFIGDARNYKDNSIFHKISLIAVLAWVGLGADGLSSSCYGPQEAFLALGNYHYLGIFVALGTAFTIFVISSSYSQTIELFPSGGGGYLVSSKLHSPFVGMVSGSALLIDYILTISVSIAAGADALFSFLPNEIHHYKLVFASIGVLLLILINLRGVRESIFVLAPIFMVFILTHVFAILYTLISHSSDYGSVINSASNNISSAHQNLGLAGMIFLIMKAFSMGAGTFTGIEAVSNGLPVLREPKVRTGKRTMRFMAVSLAFTAVGLMFSYFLFNVEFENGKTLNASLFVRLSADWGDWGTLFVYITLLSEAAILFVAAQAGFLDGPRIMANMASDRWLPARFSMLSDRLVAKNGIILIGLLALIIILVTGGDIILLVVLYSINVFITFILTESGMVKHWWQVRKTELNWKRKLAVNATALILDTFILNSVIYFKFHEGGWVTIFVTGTIVILASVIKRHYKVTSHKLKNLNELIDTARNNLMQKNDIVYQDGRHRSIDKTAIILVNGFNGMGIHTLLNVMVKFGNIFNRYIFVQVGMIDSGNFKGAGDVDALSEHVKSEAEKYVTLMKENGFESESFTDVSTDIAEDIYRIVEELTYYYMDSIVVGGKLVFGKENILMRLLHNNLLYILQKRFVNNDIPFVVMPVKV